MVSPFSTFEFRRWLVAGVLTLLAVSLQVVHAARATDGGAVASGSGHGESGARHAPIPILPVEVGGTVVAFHGGLLGVHEAGAAGPVAFPLGDDALLVRDGGAARVTDLRAGDRVRMTIDGRTGRVLQLRADSPSVGWRGRLDVAGPLAAAALVVALGSLAVRRWAAARPVPRSRRAGILAAPFRTGLSRFGVSGPTALRQRGRALGA